MTLPPVDPSDPWSFAVTEDAFLAGQLVRAWRAARREELEVPVVRDELVDEAPERAPARLPCFGDHELYRRHQLDHYDVESAAPRCAACDSAEVPA